MLKQLIRTVFPPCILELGSLIRPFYGLRGNFSSWDAAEQLLQHEGLQDYTADNILQTVWEAVRTVREGKAEFERDGVLFYEKDYNYPLLAALFYALARLGKAANILDFGGSLGSTYYQNRQILLETGMTVDWNIVEQAKFVELGRSRLPEIQFFPSIEEFMQAGKAADILLLSSVLQYFDEPYRYLERMLKAKFRYILIDRTFFNFEPHRDRLAVQHVPPAIYKAQYPVWLLSYEKVMRMMEEAGYRDICRWDSFDRIPVKDSFFRCKILPSKGFLLEQQ